MNLQLFGRKNADEVVEQIAKKSDEGTKAVKNSVERAAKADFYVKPNGDVIPSTGYRYMSETAPYLDELNKTKVIPSNANGTYFSFDKYNVASPGKLQVPHDASVKGSFDTLQIIDDIRVPNGNWGKASYLEPLTKDFPEFGPGGATQVITNGKIILDKITKLPK